MSDLRERLNKVNDRLDELEKHPSELTKDALLTDIRDLYDRVKQLGSAAVVPEPAKAEKEEVVEEKPVEPEPVFEKEELVEEEEETHPDFEMKEEEDEQEETIEISDPPIFLEVEESVIAERHKLIGAIADSEKPNDDKILAGQLGKKPLEDLRTGIPLNEKFGIIRGLFAGNASDFGDAVLKLNNAASATEMKHYLEIMKQRFGWDVESDAYQTFSVYVERKMMTLQLSNANADQ
ncbi:MAG: hypothetical protein H6602_13390 [Flavobacteriales bacterium]|nr:hypothetical protein [Flavobacteriales bacterium]MCB9192649.1 hypothetical protein [Flavobacteriales bacterium]